MAKKKRVKRVAKSRISSKVAKKSVRRVAVKPTRYSPRKIGVVIKNLILFAILSLISWLLYGVSNVGMYENLFLLLAYVLGFVALAFLIVLLVLLLLKLIRK